MAENGGTCPTAVAGAGQQNAGLCSTNLRPQGFETTLNHSGHGDDVFERLVSTSEPGAVRSSDCRLAAGYPAIETEETIMDHAGGCHCGNIHVVLRLSKPPEQNAVRTCTCSFCRSHVPRMISDPAGLLEISADDWSLVELYRFGTRTADFLICRRCGVFIAAISDLETAPCAVVNVNCLNDRASFTASATMHEFQGETLEARTSRRAANWMPAVVRR